MWSSENERRLSRHAWASRHLLPPAQPARICGRAVAPRPPERFHKISRAPVGARELFGERRVCDHGADSIDVRRDQDRCRWPSRSAELRPGCRWSVRMCFHFPFALFDRKLVCRSRGHPLPEWAPRAALRRRAARRRNRAPLMHALGGATDAHETVPAIFRASRPPGQLPALRDSRQRRHG